MIGNDQELSATLERDSGHFPSVAVKNPRAC